MKAIVVLILTCICVSLKAQTADSTDILIQGDYLPTFTYFKESEAFSSKDLNGKVVLVTLFTTWCPPCQVELAKIESEIWPKYEHNDKFELLVFGRAHTNSELITYNEKKGFPFPLYSDPDRKIYDTFAKQVIPRTYLINKSGEIIYMKKGFKTEEFDNLCKLIEQELEKVK